MSRRIIRLSLFPLLLVAGLQLQSAAFAPANDPPAASHDAHEPPVDFDRDIQPILSDTCFSCHGPDDKNRKADLRFDTKAGAFADLGGYKAIVPGQPKKSELFLRISSKEKAQRMPPAKSRKQLSKKQIELIERWIQEGAKWQEHWAFVPPHRPEFPKVKNKTWPVNGIDYFVLAKLESQGLSPSPRASKEKLIRRVTLDLTGLPPTLEEIDAFLNDHSPKAYEKVVDRLLASKRYGEHMAVAWLDAARYADTNGYQQDRTRTMWPWRDWLIEALNENMPYDEFTIAMLAGDLLPNATSEQRLATGFNRNHMLNGEGGRHPEESRVEYVVDRVETTATVWLGLTMGCARCHNHKYDPVSQKEFYEFYAYFNNISEKGNVDRGGNANPVMPLPTDDQIKKRKQLSEKLAALKKELAGANGEEKKSLKRQIDQTEKSLKGLQKSMLEVMVMDERKPVRPTYLLVRGEWNKEDKSEKLLPDVPSVLPPLPKNAAKNRLTLAKWLVDPKHPTTARVAVNRYWNHFFGTGLVKTLEDFGIQGERPSHPKLLDWLATEFVKSGWDVKHMHKLIVLSAAYQQSSKSTADLIKKDPQNRLISRGPRQRLSSLAIRDQALYLSGLLVERIGGPPVKPYQPAGVWYDLSLGKTKYQRDSGDALYRRSLYTFWRRSVGPTMFFDTTARQVCTVNVPRTNTPLHALTLMNDVTYVEAARKFAERIIQKGKTTPSRLELAFRMATGRHASDAELKTLVNVFNALRDRYKNDKAAALKLIAVGEAPRDESIDAVELASYTGVMNLILNLDEVITKE